MTALVPVGPSLPPDIAAVLKSHEDALRGLMQPGAPVRLPNVAMKSNLPPADDYRECACVCDEINSIVVSTLVGGAYAWRRADGTAL